MAATKAWIVYYPVLFLILRCVIVYSYRILLHPLAKFPGPFVAKFTDWYGAYHALRRNLHEATLQDHNRYGSVVRHGPNKLVFNSSTALQDIYRNEAFSKSKAYLMTQSKPNVHSVFSALDKRIHRSKRRIISTGLSEKSIRMFEPIMASQIDIFLGHLQYYARSRAPVNMTVHCKYLALDISSLFGFGFSLELQASARNRFIVEGMEASMFRTNIHMQFPLSKYLGVDAFLLPFLFSIKEKYKATLMGLVSRRLVIRKDAREDLFSFVTDIKDPETGDEISAENSFAEAEFFLPCWRANDFFHYCCTLFFTLPGTWSATSLSRMRFVQTSYKVTKSRTVSFLLALIYVLASTKHCEYPHQHLEHSGGKYPKTPKKVSLWMAM